MTSILNPYHFYDISKNKIFFNSSYFISNFKNNNFISPTTMLAVGYLKFYSHHFFSIPTGSIRRYSLVQTTPVAGKTSRRVQYSPIKKFLSMWEVDICYSFVFIVQ